MPVTHEQAGRSMRALIIGAGIGGLTAAIALRQAGVDTHVYEQAPELHEVGAGVQLSPNATRILIRLGFGEALARVGSRPEAIEHRRWDDGRLLLRQPLGEACERTFGSPYYHVYRPDLLAVLSAALPSGVIHLGHRCAAIADDGGDSVEVRFADGTTAVGDALIGADGIHSTVRTVLLGPESPRFSCSIAYRGLVPAERVRDLGLPRASTAWLGPRRHFVHYYVAGGRLLNFVAIVPADDWRVESWSATGEVSAAVAEFAGWHPQVRAIIDAADRTHRWGLYDRDPLTTWATGRIALLGDAAHAMLPFLAQGACQAVEDAAVITRCLGAADPATIANALQTYAALRQPRVWQVQRISRQNATTYHLPDGDAQRERDAKWAAAAGGTPYSERGWLFAYDADAA
jgi:salicylate hydroxylase